MTLGEAAALAGTHISQEYRDTELKQICKDTNILQPGALFVPLRGERFDGHDFIAEAARRGAVAALCAQDKIAAPIPLLRVQDTLRAAQAIAGGYREKLALKVIGITGSVGKTTTGIMTACVLQQAMHVYKTGDNANGQIGLTFSLFDIDASHQAAVLEMGMSQPGELSRLSRMAKPNIAIINSVGTAHIEFLGSRENILNAKMEIFVGMDPGGIAVLCGDEPLLWRLRGALGRRTVCYGIDNPEAEVRATSIEEEGGETRFEISAYGKSFPVRLPAVGRHNVLNALAAAAVGIEMELGEAQIAAGLASFRSAKGRQRIYEKNGMTIIEDCYNASPDSLRAALGVLASVPAAGRRIAVMGGMRELGSYAGEAHRDCGAYAALRADRLFFFGEGARYYAEGARAAGMAETAISCYDTHAALADTLRQYAKPGDVLLFKGSRAMRMEVALDQFLGELS